VFSHKKYYIFLEIWYTNNNLCSIIFVYLSLSIHFLLHFKMLSFFSFSLIFVWVCYMWFLLLFFGWFNIYFIYLIGIDISEHLEINDLICLFINFVCFICFLFNLIWLMIYLFSKVLEKTASICSFFFGVKCELQLFLLLLFRALYS